MAFLFTATAAAVTASAAAAKESNAAAASASAAAAKESDAAKAIDAATENENESETESDDEKEIPLDCSIVHSIRAEYENAMRGKKHCLKKPKDAWTATIEYGVVLHTRFFDLFAILQTI